MIFLKSCVYSFKEVNTDQILLLCIVVQQVSQNVFNTELTFTLMFFCL